MPRAPLVSYCPAIVGGRAVHRELRESRPIMNHVLLLWQSFAMVLVPQVPSIRPTTVAAELPTVSTFQELAVAISSRSGDDTPVVGFFSSRSCAACRTLRPQVCLLAARWPSMRFVEVVSSRSPESAAAMFDVFQTPTFVTFYRGEPLRRFPGITAADGFDNVCRHVQDLATGTVPAAALLDEDSKAEVAVKVRQGWAARAALAAIAVVHPLARPRLLTTALLLSPAVVGAGAAAAVGSEAERKQAMDDDDGSPIDWIPVASQARSMVQMLAGDGNGALATQKRFTTQCPIVSQLRSLGELLQGDAAAARRTQLRQLKMLKGLLLGT